MKKLDACFVYLLLSGASAFFFSLIVTMASIYRVTVAHLNPLQLVLVGTALEATIFVFEVPSGVVADVYSRRLSIIVGLVIVGAAFVVQGCMASFIPILLTEMGWGIGYTFTSGAQDAWIADELGADKVGPVYLRGAQVGQIASLAGILASVALASVQLRLPLVVGGGLYVVLGLFLAFVMPEQGFRPLPRESRASWQAMLHTLQSAFKLVRRQPVLVTILVIGAIYGMSSEAFDRLWEAHFLTNFQFPSLGQFKPVVWFGLIDVVEMLLGIGAVEIARRRVDTTSQRAVAGFLFATNALLTASLLGFGLAGDFELALATYWAARLARHVHSPLYTAWTNQSIDDPQVRATLISATSQTDAMGQMLGGPIVGLIGNQVSLNAAFIAAGIILSPVLLLFRLAVRPGRSRQ